MLREKPLISMHMFLPKAISAYQQLKFGYKQTAILHPV